MPYIDSSSRIPKGIKRQARLVMGGNANIARPAPSAVTRGIAPGTYHKRVVSA